MISSRFQEQTPLRRRKEHPFLCYSVLFLLCAGELLWLMSGRSFVRNADANVQHYQAVSYIGQWLRSGLKGLLAGKGWNAPLWTMQIGMGSDVLTTLHFYGLGEPIVLLSMFFGGDSVEVFYAAAIFLRLYLAGLFCVCFFRVRGVGQSGSVVGALLYAFSGFAVNPGIFHPFFAIPLVYLPLLLTGVELAYTRSRYRLFTLAVFLSAISNLYFFYMLAIFTAVYALLRYFSAAAKPSFRELLRYGAKFLGAAILAGCFAAPILLPNVMGILSSARFTVVRDRMTLYAEEYYKQLPGALIANFHPYYLYIAVPSVCILFTLLLISTSPRRYRGEKLLLLLMLAIVLLPAGGAFLNGNSYTTNRWIWALILMLSWCTAKCLHDLETLRWKQLLVGVALTAGYSVLCISWSGFSETDMRTPLILLWSGTALVLLLKALKQMKLLRVCLGILVVVSLLLNNYNLFHKDKGNLASKFVEAGTLYKLHHPFYLSNLGERDDAAQTRLEQSRIRGHINDAMLNGVNGDSFYYSNIDSGTASFQRSQWLGNAIGQRYEGLDLRSHLMLAMGVKYYAISPGASSIRPFGYDQLIGQSKEALVYSSNYALPLAYVYDTVLHESEASEVLQRQQAILQCALIPDSQETSLPTASPEYSYRQLPYTIGPKTKGVTLSDHRIVAEYNGAVLQLLFDEVTEEEIYLLFEGITTDLGENDLTTKTITISDGHSGHKLQVVTPRDNFYCGYEDFIVSLYYCPEGRSWVRLVFNQSGTYRFRSFSLAAQPMDAIPSQTDALQHSGVTDLTVGKNEIRFKTERSAPGMACVSIPFSKGWKATVDGKTVPVVSVNGGLCGIEIREGTHEIQLHYTTPGLTVGCLLCIAGLLTGTAFWVIQRKKTRRKPQTEDAALPDIITEDCNTDD